MVGEVRRLWHKQSLLLSGFVLCDSHHDVVAKHWCAAKHPKDVIHKQARLVVERIQRGQECHLQQHQRRGTGCSYHENEASANCGEVSRLEDEAAEGDPNDIVQHVVVSEPVPVSGSGGETHRERERGVTLRMTVRTRQLCQRRCQQ